ncbi:MAG: GGDEF domain-containing response regulator [Planctomycetota bacterium]
MRVLIAEDDPISRRVLEATLKKWGHEVQVACDGAEAWEMFQDADVPKLGIIDWMMPGIDGVELCKRVRKIAGKDRSYIYLILLTAKGQSSDVVEGLEAGADDYITKPFDNSELKARLQAAKRVLDLEDELLTAQETLRYQATHDSLTGIWTRAAIFEILEKELDRSEREDKPVGVAVVDIDRFKSVNDTYGHDAGDLVLRQTAKILVSKMRKYDAIGRIGGEEFLIVLPGCPLETIATRAEELRSAFANTEIPVSGGTVSLTLCMGVTTSRELSTVDPETLVQAADAAMYEAKRSGRNRVEIARSAA